MEHFFTTYIRTKTIFQRRLHDLKDYSSVKIYAYELKKLNVNDRSLLQKLKDKGEINFTEDGRFVALNDGPIDPSLLEKTRRRERMSAALTDLHIYMRDQLKHVTIEADDKDLPVYFKAFLDHKDKQLKSFFTVDAFSGRIHTPVVNLKGDLRKALRLHGKPLVSLDVKQMQPTILAKVLHRSIGDNPFSTAIFDGQDVYVLLQNNAHLATRDEAKKLLFKLIFGKPMDNLTEMFQGDSNWVRWINDYKSRIEPKNPHKEEMHTNLAWLLQYSEVKVMTDIWNRLKKLRISFLTIHDDILCNDKDSDKVHKVMKQELQGHFKNFKITVTK